MESRLVPFSTPCALTRLILTAPDPPLLAFPKARTNVVVHVVHKRFLASILTDYGDLAR